MDDCKRSRPRPSAVDEEGREVVRQETKVVSGAASPPQDR